MTTTLTTTKVINRALIIVNFNETEFSPVNIEHEYNLLILISIYLSNCKVPTNTNLCDNWFTRKMFFLLNFLLNLKRVFRDWAGTSHHFFITLSLRVPELNYQLNHLYFKIFIKTYAICKSHREYHDYNKKLY